MTRFYPIYVRRSDGKLEVPGKAGRLRDRNAPSADQLDRTPNSKGIADYYREIGVDEIKHMDWRRKLAGMLVREIGGKEHEEKQTTCILVALPENYRIFEHIKSRVTDNDGAPAQNKKNHAGGGHDRQDAYLYGHPGGPKKRFRSPADFFPHLLWLCTDPTGNTDNCSCKLCCPEEIEERKPPPPTQPVISAATNGQPAKSEGKAIDAQPVPGPGRALDGENPKRPVSSAPLAMEPHSINSPVPRPSSTATPLPTPSTLPQPRTQEQQIDCQYNKFHYRPGEVIWFFRGVAWGLGLVVQRYAFRNEKQQEVRCYVLQPLSHPFNHPPTTTIMDENLIRPWLAWSPPDCTHDTLNRQAYSYESVDWRGLIEGRYGPGDPLVDGSIIAAKGVDNTFTLSDAIKRSNIASGGFEQRYNSMFIGGEKIWVGDVLRVRLVTEPPLTVMVLMEIVERVAPSSAPTYHLIGDIYTLSSLDPTVQEVPFERRIPHRMREDTRWRNNMTAAKGVKKYWKLASANQRLSITDIKGRWHESSYLLPLLAREQMANGTIDPDAEPNLWLNTRNDPNGKANANSPGNKFEHREEAFGRSIPQGTKIKLGIDAPPSQPQSKQEGPQQQQQQEQQKQQSIQQQQQQPSSTGAADSYGHAGGAGDVKLDEFMNFDDDVPVFGQTYGASSQTQQFL